MYQLECQEAIGMESGAISDGQISASSQHSNPHAAILARLHLPESESKKGWAAATNDANQWLQIDLERYYIRITRVATQGRNSSYANQWVTEYKLQYSNDGVNIKYYREQGQTTEKVEYNRSNMR